jgi:predicted amidohydrolase YtcJ
VIPGMVDGHAHLAGLGESLETVRLTDTTSWKQVVDLTAERAKATPQGEWITGDGWDQNDWAGDKAFPVHAALSAAVPDHPVILYRIDGHAAVVNAKALALAGVTKDTKDPQGGKVLHAKDGSPTGVLVDDAMDLVSALVPAATVAQVKDRVLKAQAECLKSGLTGMHDAGVGETGLAAYEELEREGKLVLRVYVMLANDPKLLEKRFAAKPVIGDRLTVRSVKLQADGALGSRGAALLAPYDDDKANTGLLRMDASEIEAITTKALEAGFQVGVHAIGDRANRAALNGFERARAAVPSATDPRLRIEHAQVLAPDDLPRFAKLGVIASMQPTHATSDMPWAEARIGKERAKGAYAWRTLQKSGAKLSFGSDFPVEGVAPLWGIHAAVTRSDRKGTPKGGWRPEEKLTAKEALEGFTIGPAYAAFEEASRGTIEAGKLADLVVLSGDPLTVPPEQIPSLKIVKTIVGGKIVFGE